MDQPLPHPFRERAFGRADRSLRDRPCISRVLEHAVPVELEATMGAITGEATFESCPMERLFKRSTRYQCARKPLAATGHYRSPCYSPFSELRQPRKKQAALPDKQGKTAGHLWLTQSPTPRELNLSRLLWVPEVLHPLPCSPPPPIRQPPLPHQLAQEYCAPGADICSYTGGFLPIPSSSLRRCAAVHAPSRQTPHAPLLYPADSAIAAPETLPAILGKSHSGRNTN